MGRLTGLGRQTAGGTTRNPPLAHPRGSSRPAPVGLAYGLGAYLIWGFIPLYFKLVADVPPLVVLCHRVVWSAVFLVAVVWLWDGWGELADALRSGRTLALMACTAMLLAANWYTFIHAVTTGQVLQSSVGYFTLPIVSVMLGVGVLRERLRAWQILSVLLACAGVAVLALSLRQLPWIAIVLSLSFALYGLVRKIAHVGPLPGLFVESAIMFLPALAGIWALGGVRFTPAKWLLLMLAGAVTAVPLLLFAAAARRLRLATIGFLNYLTPTCQFLLAVLAFREPFTARHLLSFSLIWAALAIYSADSWASMREQR